MAEFSFSMPYVASDSGRISLVQQPDRRQQSDRRERWRGGRRVSDFSALLHATTASQSPEHADTLRLH